MRYDENNVRVQAIVRNTVNEEPIKEGNIFAKVADRK